MIRRLDLLLLPIVLDILLWVAPRLSVEPIFGQAANLYAGLANDVSSEGATVFQQLADMLTALGDSINLLGLLVNGTLFHVPSLMVVLPEAKAAAKSIDISSIVAAGALSVGLSILGLLIGVIYMALLAQALPLGEGDKKASTTRFVQMVLRQWIRTLLFVVAVIILLVALYIPGVLVAGILGLISPLFANGVGLLLSGLTIVILFYLYFVPVGIVLDDLPIRAALWRSMSLVRHNLWTTVGFILLTNLIGLGIGLLIRDLALASPFGLALAVVINAFIGTGLVMALLVFYRTRLILMAEQMYSQSKHVA